MSSTRSVASGAVIGFVFALCVFLLAVTGVSDRLELDGIMGYLGAPAVYFVTRIWSDAPDLVFTIVFLCYGALVGAILGWCASKSIVLTILFILVLVGVHYKTEQIISEEIAGVVAAVKSLVDGSAVTGAGGQAF